MTLLRIWPTFYTMKTTNHWIRLCFQQGLVEIHSSDQCNKDSRGSLHTGSPVSRRQLDSTMLMSSFQHEISLDTQQVQVGKITTWNVSYTCQTSPDDSIICVLEKFNYSWKLTAVGSPPQWFRGIFLNASITQWYLSKANAEVTISGVSCQIPRKWILGSL